MAKVRVTNITDGFRSIIPAFAIEAIEINPGKHADIDLTEQEQEDAAGTGWFSISEPVDEAEAKREANDAAPVAAQPVHISRMNVEQLTALAAEEGVTFAEGSTKKQIREAIEAKREANDA